MTNLPPTKLLRASLAVSVKGPKPYNNRQFMVSSEKMAPIGTRMHAETINKIIGADKNISVKLGISSFPPRTEPILVSGGWREGISARSPPAP
jgi:hypothetical protein